jgi:hypothetical protein
MRLLNAGRVRNRTPRFRLFARGGERMRKLSLSKETVAMLDDEILSQVYGASGHPTHIDTADTKGCCPDTTNSCSC